jgi:hypothetical protein
LRLSKFKWNTRRQFLLDFPLRTAERVATRIVVGAVGETVSGFTAAGHVYIFTADTGSLVKTLSSPNPIANGIFGQSVGMTSTTIVGAPDETASGQSQAGHAYTFSATTGSLSKTYSSLNVQASGFFGWSVAISGGTIVVGATGESVSGFPSAGNVYTFSVNNVVPLDHFSSPNALNNRLFGYSVAISGSTILVGAQLETAMGFNAGGHAYIF